MTDHPGIQHLNIKIFAESDAIDLAPAIPVFQRWIQDDVCEELLIDVADYRHVPAGPGVLLVGHEANYSLDQSFFRLGLLYARKTTLEGSMQDKLLQAFYAALRACERLESEPEFAERLKFRAGECEVIVNDRLLAPNTDDTSKALRPEIEHFFARVYGTGAFTLKHLGEPRERFRAGISAKTRVPLSSLLPLLAPKSAERR